MATRGQERPIDRSSPMPFYHQLQEILKEDLENGRWKPGDLIPSEGELASTYQVSRTVIRKSLDILEGDGRVIRVKGKGTLVAAPKFQYETAADPSLWKKRWTTLPRLSRLLDVRRVAVGTRLGKLLDLGSASEVLEITFTHSIEGAPSSLGQTFVRMDASPQVAALASEAALSLEEGGDEAHVQLAQRYGVAIDHSEVTIEAIPASAVEADKLDIVPGTPVFMLSSTDYAKGGRPLAFTRSVVRGDHFRFSVIIRRHERGSRK